MEEQCCCSVDDVYHTSPGRFTYCLLRHHYAAAVYVTRHHYYAAK